MPKDNGKVKKHNLIDEQKWEIAKYCIQTRNVIIGPDGKFSNWRVTQTKSAEEVNTWNEAEIMGLPKVTAYSCKISLDFYNLVADLTNNLPVVPPQESVQEDMLKIEIEKLNNELRISQEELRKAATVIKGYQDILTQIKKFAVS